MGMDNLSDALASKCFFPESSFNVIQDFLMSRIVFVQDILELQVSRPKAVAEVLSENPAAICDYQR